MTQHSEAVEQQREILELEKQAKQIIAIDTRYKDGLWYKQIVDYADGRRVTEQGCARDILQDLEDTRRGGSARSPAREAVATVVTVARRCALPTPGALSTLIHQCYPSFIDNSTARQLINTFNNNPLVGSKSW